MPSSKAYDAKRRVTKSWRKWYNTKDWHRLRAAALRRDSILTPEGRLIPVCQETGVLLTGKPPAPDSPIVDHTVRHRGIWALFFSLSNVKVVSKAFHDSTKQRWERVGRKQIGADGWPVAVEPPRGWVSWDELHQPTDIGPSKPPLTLIFGPPAAGKSTYVKAHAGPQDAIVDSDIEATRLGLDQYTTETNERIIILKARNAALKQLQSSTAPAAWFSGIGDKARIRAHWANYLKPTRIIILMTPQEVCIERVKRSDRTHKDRQIEAIIRWHREFEPRTGEQIVRNWTDGQ